MNNGFNNNQMYNGNVQQPMNMQYNQQQMNNMPYNNYYNPQAMNQVNSNNNTKIFIIIGVIVLAFVIIYFFGGSNKKIRGKWSCTGTASVVFEFNSNNTFKISAATTDDRYIKGKFTYEETTGDDKSYTYWNYRFVADTTYINGQTSTKTIYQDYKMGLSKDGKTLLINSTNGSERYTCVKK